MQMTQKQIVKVLAERDGKWVHSETQRPGSLWPDVRIAVSHNKNALPYYLHSRDVLAGVLAKLSEGEWKILEHDLEIQFIDSPLWGELGWLQFLLTLPPEQLSECVAEAIVKAKGKE